MLARTALTHLSFSGPLVVVALMAQGCLKGVKCSDPDLKPPQCVERWDNGKQEDNKRGLGNARPQEEPIPDRTFMLNVINVESSSWWKSCMYAVMNGDANNRILIGCNKDNATEKKRVTLPAFSDRCNQLSLHVEVFKNTKPCTPEGDCGNNYSPSPDWNRRTEHKDHQQFFVVKDAAALLPLESKIKLDGVKTSTSLEEVESSAKLWSSAPGNVWFRVFFEDQSDENYSEWQKDPVKWEQYGIDYKNYIVDIKAENLRLKVEGTTASSCL